MDIHKIYIVKLPLFIDTYISPLMKNPISRYADA